MNLKRNKRFYMIMLFITLSFFTLTACTELDKKNSEVNKTNTTNTTNTTNVDNTPSKSANIGQSTIDVDGVKVLDKTKYSIRKVNECDLSGDREPNVMVDVGVGDREYWAYTNEYGQLIRVEAKEIILQDEDTEPVTAQGRYCIDEAKVPGTERKDMDEGHIIADSLGGVSNAYNITPQNSTLNRHGDQAYMEKVIRDAGGAKDFVAIIEYPNNETQIPSYYEYHYTVNDNKVVDRFPNGDPEKYVKEEPEKIEAKNIKAYELAEGKIIGNKNSMIYHKPGGSGYMSVLSKNAVFFDSEAEAENAGFRPSKR